MFWSYANGWCPGFLRDFCSFVTMFWRRGRKNPYGYRTVTVCTGPYGACASTVRTRTCLRIPVEFYDHCTWPVRVPVMTVSAHTGYWPRTIAYMYVPSTGEKRCACTTFRYGLLTGIRGLYGLKKPEQLCAGPHGMPYDHPRVTGILVRKMPVNYPAAPCDLGNIRTVYWVHLSILPRSHGAPGSLRAP